LFDYDTMNYGFEVQHHDDAPQSEANASLNRINNNTNGAAAQPDAQEGDSAVPAESTLSKNKDEIVQEKPASAGRVLDHVDSVVLARSSFATANRPAIVVDDAAGDEVGLLSEKNGEALDEVEDIDELLERDRAPAETNGSIPEKHAVTVQVTPRKVGGILLCGTKDGATTSPQTPGLSKRLERKVTWPDDNGMPLTAVKEFEPSIPQDDDEDSEDNTQLCTCTIQ
jgi:hypothetical protein